MKRSTSAGFMPVSIIINVILALLFVGAAGFSVWAYMNYQDQKNNVEAKVAEAVEIAKVEQTKVDEKAFEEKEKSPTRKLTGPTDLGALSLDYPKTWSVYIENDGSNNEFDVYMHPGAITSLRIHPPYALRVNVINSSYESSVAGLQSLVKEGGVKASPIRLNDVNGLRIDGKFSDTVTGSMVIFKIRDKTLRLLTESPTFVPDFDKIVLPSLKFNK